MHLALSTARAVIDQARSGARAEVTILLGDNATAPGFTGDEEAVRDQILKALNGDDLKVSADCRRHLGETQIARADIANFESLGLDPAVAVYHVIVMGALSVKDDDWRINIFTDARHRRRVVYDLSIDGMVWTTNADDGCSIVLDYLPETALVAIAGRIDGNGPIPLEQIVSHPLVEGRGFRVASIRRLALGRVDLRLAEAPDTTPRSATELLG